MRFACRSFRRSRAPLSLSAAKKISVGSPWHRARERQSPACGGGSCDVAVARPTTVGRHGFRWRSDLDGPAMDFTEVKPPARNSTTNLVLKPRLGQPISGALTGGRRSHRRPDYDVRTDRMRSPGRAIRTPGPVYTIWVATAPIPTESIRGTAGKTYTPPPSNPTADDQLKIPVAAAGFSRSSVRPATIQGREI